MRWACLALILLGLLAAVSCAPARKSATESTGVTREACIEMFARAYVPDRSGQIFLVPEEGEFLITVEDSTFYHFMHGSPWDYDVRIPLLFHGEPFIRRGTSSQSATLQDIAPTLLTLLDASVPETMTGHVLAEALASSSKLPGVVVLLVLDGFGADTWSRFESQLPNLSRLKREGAWFSNARLNYLPSVTSTGHATASTGTDPRIHGIHGNSTFDWAEGKDVPPFKDMNPKDYLAPTLSDYWNLETAGQAVIIAQGTTARATVALAGHGACEIPGMQATGSKTIVAMFDPKTTGWTTNPECDRLPEYLASQRADADWETSWLGHSIKDGDTFLRTGFFPRFQMNALLEMIEKENVGRDSFPDLLLINLKTPDYVAHQYGPESPEMGPALHAVDEEVGRLAAALQNPEKAGLHGSVLVITADHGMPSQCEAPCVGAHFTRDLASAIDQHFGVDSLAAYIDESGYQIYMNEQELGDGRKLSDVAQFVESLPYIRYALTKEEIGAAKLTKPSQRRIGIGFAPGFSVWVPQAPGSAPRDP